MSEDGDEGRSTLPSNGPNDDGDEDESLDMFNLFFVYLPIESLNSF